MSVFEQVAQGAPTTPANAWPVEVTDGTNVLGTPTHPVRIDPTGTTTQPVSGTVAVSSVAGTVAVTESGTWNIGTVTAVSGVTNPVTVAQATAANLKATVLNQDGSGNTLTSTSGALDSNLKTIGGTAPSTGTGASGAGIPRVTVSNDSAVKVWDGTHTLGVDGNGNAGVSINEVAGSGMGQRLMAASIPVAIASDQSLTVTVGAVYNNQAGTAASGAVPTTAGSYLSIISDLFTWSTLLLTYVPVSGLPSAGGVFQVEGSPDGTNWTPMTGALLDATPTQVTEYSTSNFVEVSARYNLAGFPYVRIRTLTAFTGTIDVFYSLTTALSDDTGFSHTLLTTQAGDPVIPVNPTQYGSGTIPQAQFCQAAVSPVFTTTETNGTGASFNHDVQPGNTIIVTVVTSGDVGDVAHVTDDAGNLYTMLTTFAAGTPLFPTAGEGPIGGTIWVFACVHRNLYDPSPVITATVTPGDLFSSFYTVLSEYAGLGAYSLSGTLPWCYSTNQGMASGSPHFVAGGTISPTVPSMLFNMLLSTFTASTGPLTYTDGDSAIYTAPRFQGASSSLVATGSTRAADVVIGDQTVAPGTGLTQGWTVFPPAGYSSSFEADLFTIAFPIGPIGSVALTNRASDGTLQPLQVDSSNNLKVAVAGTITSKIQDGSGNNLNSTGGSLNVNVTGGGTTGAQYAAGTAVGTPTGTVALGWDGTDVRSLSTTSAGALNVAVTGTPTVAISGTVPVSGTVGVSGTVPVSGTVAISGTPTITGTVTLSGTPTVQGTVFSKLQDYNGNSLLSTAGSLYVNVSNTPAVTISGTPAVSGTVTAKNQDGSGNNLTSTSGSLNVNVTGGTTSVTQYAAGAAAPTPTGTAAMGWDGTDVRVLSTSATGVLNVAGTVAMTGSSGSSVDGAQNTAAPAHILQVGGVYNSSAPSVPTGDLTALQTDASGSLKVSIAGTSVTPLVQIQSSGTNLTNTSGALNVNVTNNSNAGASATGSAVPASAEYTGFNSSGTLVGVSSTNPFPVAVISGGSSGAQYAPGTVSGTGTMGTVVMGTYGTGSARTANALVCDSMGTLLPAVQGAVSTSAPTYTTGQYGLLSLNTTGGLRVDGSGATQPVSGSVSIASSGTALTNTSGALNVNITGGSTSGTQYAAGTSVSTPTGTVAMGTDGTAARALSTTAAGLLNVSLNANGSPVLFSNPVPISATGSTNTKTNPIHTTVVDGTNISVMAATGTAPATSTFSMPVAAVLYAGATPTAIGTPVAAGTGTLSGNALTCNSPVYVGTAPVSSSNCVPVSATTAAQSATNPMFNRLTDGTTAVAAAVSALGTAPTGTEVMAVNAVNLPSAAAGAALSASVKSAQATAVNIKASAGNLYGLAITSATATAGFIQFFNTATTATTGCVWAIPIAASGSVFIPPSVLAMLNFSAGIAINVATPLNGTTTQITWTGTIMYM